MLHRTPRRSLRPTSLLIVPMALIALAAIATACGGDDGDGGNGASAEQVAAALESPAALNSYRYEMTIDTSGSAAGGLEGVPSGLTLGLELSMELSGAVVAPDREQSKLTADLGFLTLEIETIRIGDRVWMRESGGQWELQSTADSGPLDLGFDLSPTDFFGDDASGEGLDVLRSVLSGIDGTRETVNGVEAVRFDLSAEQFAQAFPDGGDLAGGDADGLAADATISIWVARDSGIPVRLVLETTIAGEDGGDGAGGEGGVRLELSLTDLDSDDIKIEPPE